MAERDSESSTASPRKLGDTDLTVADPAKDIRGRKVPDKDGEETGDANDRLVDDRENKVRFLRVAAGGFLGLGPPSSSSRKTPSPASGTAPSAPTGCGSAWPGRRSTTRIWPTTWTTTAASTGTTATGRTGRPATPTRPTRSTGFR